jgi:hypothetical protein
MSGKVFQFGRDIETSNGIYREHATVFADDLAAARALLVDALRSFEKSPRDLAPAYDISSPRWRTNEIELDRPQVLDLHVTR